MNTMRSAPRVLIVEDDVLIAMLLEEMLLDLGTDVAGTAANLNQALQLLEENSIDAAILDVNIGRDRSFPVADALRARAIPYAFATGFGDSALPEAYATDCLIEKPYTLADVEEALAKLLQ